jgi:hypothetical protein
MASNPITVRIGQSTSSRRGRRPASPTIGNADRLRPSQPCSQSNIQRDSAPSNPTVPIRILRQVLLVRVAPDEDSAAEIAQLHRHYCRIGRVPVDEAVVPSVDHSDNNSAKRLRRFLGCDRPPIVCRGFHRCSVEYFERRCGRPWAKTGTLILPKLRQSNPRWQDSSARPLTAHPVYSLESRNETTRNV